VLELYDIQGVINNGRDGTKIFRAFRLRNNKDIISASAVPAVPVAVKLIPVRNERRMLAVKREIAVLERLRPHRNIFRYLGSHDLGKAMLLEFELCNGPDLLDRVNASCGFDELTTLAYFRQLLMGLEHIHNQNIAHRDVKLDNIFTTTDGVLKIGDFGFAQEFDADERFNTACGTLTYAAPELLEPESQISFAPEPADIWGLGVVLFAMRSGSLPFDGNLDDELVRGIRAGNRRPMLCASSSLRNLLNRMLEVDPSKRITLAEIKRHPWLRSDMPTPETTPKTPTKKASSASNSPAVPTFSARKDPQAIASSSDSNVSAMVLRLLTPWLRV